MSTNRSLESHSRTHPSEGFLACHAGITLDGNTFEDSPSVDKKIFVPAAGVGATVGNRRFQLSFSYIFRGEEFDGQPDNEKFASIAIAYLF